jgi:hypothetical protein
MEVLIYAKRQRPGFNAADMVAGPHGIVKGIHNVKALIPREEKTRASLLTSRCKRRIHRQARL